jgi:hypothetical protein
VLLKKLALNLRVSMIQLRLRKRQRTSLTLVSRTSNTLERNFNQRLKEIKFKQLNLFEEKVMRKKREAMLKV